MEFCHNGKVGTLSFALFVNAHYANTDAIINCPLYVAHVIFVVVGVIDICEQSSWPQV